MSSQTTDLHEFFQGLAGFYKGVLHHHQPIIKFSPTQILLNSIQTSSVFEIKVMGNKVVLGYPIVDLINHSIAHKKQEILIISEKHLWIHGQKFLASRHNRMFTFHNHNNESELQNFYLKLEDSMLEFHYQFMGRSFLSAFELTESERYTQTIVELNKAL